MDCESTRSEDWGRNGGCLSSPRSKPAGSTRGCRLDMSLAGALELDTVTQARLMKSADHAEFYAAFRESRQPKWTGR